MAAALPACYHGAITRKECEELMGRKNKDGSYLIRDSETIQGALCLCVFKQKTVYTYRLLQTHTGNYTLLTAGGLQETYFKTLDDLIRHYKRKNQGLVIHLRHSIKRKTALLIQPSRHESMRLDQPEPGPASTSRQSPRRGSSPHGGLRPIGPVPKQVKSAPQGDPDYENDTACSEYVEVLPD